MVTDFNRLIGVACCENLTAQTCAITAAGAAQHICAIPFLPFFNGDAAACALGLRAKCHEHGVVKVARFLREFGAAS